MHWNQGAPEAGCRIAVMLRKGFLLLLGFGVLAATGVASLSPCCGLEELTRPASTEIRDCCARADCCRSEKRGPAPAALSLKAPEAADSLALQLSDAPWLASGAAVPPAAFAGQFLFDKDHSPPLDGRGTHLRISVFRV